MKQQSLTSLTHWPDGFICGCCGRQKGWLLQARTGKIVSTINANLRQAIYKGPPWR